jgi:hypothetical protein
MQSLETSQKINYLSKLFIKCFINNKTVIINNDQNLLLNKYFLYLLLQETTTTKINCFTVVPNYFANNAKNLVLAKNIWLDKKQLIWSY